MDVADFNRQESAIKNDALLTLIKTIKDKRRPLIGYFGAIADWVDIKMIRSIAVTRKDWEFVFIGRVWTEIKEISNLPNVHLPGLISYSNLHLYAKEFDVAIVPFIVNELTDSVSPIKFFEYAALGLPIIATPFFEIKQYADNSFVRLAEDEQSMISAIEDLLEHKDMKMSQAAQEFAWANHWRERAEVIDQQINDAHYKI